MCYGNDREGLGAMNPPNDGRERAVSLGLAALFCAIAGLAALDLTLDLAEATTITHVVIEGAVVLVGLGGAGWMVARVRTLTSQAQELRVETSRLAAHLDASREEAARWRREASDLIAGLSAAIDLQFERWELTPAEKAVALLLLKGLSHKEVASLREVSETTVRQQARAIYRKAGLAGRNDLAAFFLEDLLGPRG
jgi:DNA-binding CsgD family transcriptional regulator/outer membrane murein-binding lipoprotein Lpp